MLKPFRWIMNFFSSLLTILALLIRNGECACYFPGDLQGIWVTQLLTPDVEVNFTSSADVTLEYSNINITYDYISNWGHCYQRFLDNNIILATKFERGYWCFLCIRLFVASVNVISLVRPKNSQCHSTFDDAALFCPTATELLSKQATEIMLYRLYTTWGENSITRVSCPLNGIYTFTYDKGSDANGYFSDAWRYDDRRLNDINHYTCERNTSELSNCEKGSRLKITYRDCSFSSHLQQQKIHLECLGSWKGIDGQNYFAVLDTSVTGFSKRPRYKCGIYHEDKNSGRTHVAFSSDSTCTSQLKSHTEGFERYTLTPAPQMPFEKTESRCRFPESLYGQWHHTHISPNKVVFKDYENLTKYTAVCISRVKDDEEKFVVLTRSHCNDWQYNCLWLKRRTKHILEFMLGLTPSKVSDPSLCNRDNFGLHTTWITQPKSKTGSSCPISGFYEGELPGSPGYCAQMYSDCHESSRMFFAINECKNHTSIYERKAENRYVSSIQEINIPIQNKRARIPKPQLLKNNHFNNRHSSNNNVPSEIQVTHAFHSPAINVGSSRLPLELPPEIQVGTNSRHDYRESPILWTPPDSDTPVLWNPDSNESKVQTGTFLRIVDRSKRQKRQIRMSNARTTTIRWEWGSSNKRYTTPIPDGDYNNQDSFSRYPMTYESPHRNNRSYYSDEAEQSVKDHNYRRPYDRRPYSYESEKPYQYNNDQDYLPSWSSTEMPNVKRFGGNTPTGNRFISTTREKQWRPFSDVPSNINHNINFESTTSSSLNSNRNFDTYKITDDPFHVVDEIHKPKTSNKNNGQDFIYQSEQLGNHHGNIDPYSDDIYNTPNSVRIQNSVTLNGITNGDFIYWNNQDVTTPSPNIPKTTGRATWIKNPTSFLEEQKPIISTNQNEFRKSSFDEMFDQSKYFVPLSERHPVIEERDYQCVDDWRENNEIYALTYRRDIRTYECFVGHIKEDENTQEIYYYIKEAGELCKRELNPQTFGMKLRKIGVEVPCHSKIEISNNIQEDASESPLLAQKPAWVPKKRPTEPWKLITKSNTAQITSGSLKNLSNFYYIVFGYLFIFLSFKCII